ncbi:hypothetical protein Syun_028378 [Stephania yunnanensis]|uniref:RRM domain-containing protein n=1 Tax=Stephania yunnanensis TaxID=152371 RepID=A0AAP0EMH7_9MAGN
MAAVAESAIVVPSDDHNQQLRNRDDDNENDRSDSKSEFETDMRKLVDLLSKLNPSAKEFVPSSYALNPQSVVVVVPDDNRKSSNDDQHFNNNRRRRNYYNQGRRRMNARTVKAQREDCIRRTVYVSDIDQQVTEEQLARLFIGCGQVVDCRVCGDPHSVLRFAFIEFSDEYGARTALNLSGTMLGYYPVRVLPSKTAILPVNPSFLPRVSRLRLLGDHMHSTRIAFVEFVIAESAIIALNCSGMVLGALPVRIDEVTEAIGDDRSSDRDSHHAGRGAAGHHYRWSGRGVPPPCRPYTLGAYWPMVLKLGANDP